MYYVILHGVLVLGFAAAVCELFGCQDIQACHLVEFWKVTLNLQLYYIIPSGSQE